MTTRLQPSRDKSCVQQTGKCHKALCQTVVRAAAPRLSSPCKLHLVDTQQCDAFDFQCLSCRLGAGHNETESSNIVAHDPTIGQNYRSEWNPSPCPAQKSRSKVHLRFELSHDQLNTIICIPSRHGVREPGISLLGNLNIYSVILVSSV